MDTYIQRLFSFLLAEPWLLFTVVVWTYYVLHNKSLRKAGMKGFFEDLLQVEKPALKEVVAPKSDKKKKSKSKAKQTKEKALPVAEEFDWSIYDAPAIWRNR